MQFNFSIQKISVYGSYGEFSVGVGPSKVSAKYLLTKIRPGQQGTWENQLASQMAPWREVFNIEELSFDELIQRDLDDSRVAHDMIPYLLGETGHHARFFPPILAVLVPKRQGKSGIAPYYPEVERVGKTEVYGNLFDFRAAEIDGQISPLGQISYNPQQSAMVIVDGQHRAMAVLALHRQLNKSWGSDPFAPYYSHLEISPEAVAHIELPVCLIYFPDINENNKALEALGVNLTTVCREIFSVVNKSAKSVSKSRELLLNDEDFAAFMMRQTLTGLKDRANAGADAARIYSFEFGDDEGDGASQVMAGKLEYCSGVAIHKMHAATAFGYPACFSLLKSSDVTDGRYVRNPARPAELLGGVSGVTLQAVGRRSAKNHSPATVDTIVAKLGGITDAVVRPLFDRLRPYVCHNASMRELLEGLNDPEHKADVIQSKCRALLFEGSGVRQVFEQHCQRLQERKLEFVERGEALPTHLTRQIEYCESVNRALESIEDKLKLTRAFKLFGIDKEGFLGRDSKPDVEAETKIVRTRAKNIMDAVSTQAFQIGFLMAVLTAVELIRSAGDSFENLTQDVNFVTELYLTGFNSLFAVSSTKHKTLSGFISEPRASAFDPSGSGFRGLLASGNVRELNEKQWEFFRYMIMEVVHSRSSLSQIKDVLCDTRWASQSKKYIKALPDLLSDLAQVRKQYFEAAVRTATNSAEFKRELDLMEAQARAASASADDQKKIIDDAIAAKRDSVIERSKEHLRSTMKYVDSPEQILKRFMQAVTTGTESEDGEMAVEPVVLAEVVSTASVDAALVADDVLHSTNTDEIIDPTT